MKTLKKCAIIILTMCLTLSLFCGLGCNKEDQFPLYYEYQSVEMEMDIEVPEISLYEEIADQLEDIINVGLKSVEKTYNTLYANNIVEITRDKLVWYMENAKAEFVFDKAFGNKTNISEVDKSTVDMLSAMLSEQGATITEGMKFRVEKEGDYIELSVEIYGTQQIFEERC